MGRMSDAALKPFDATLRWLSQFVGFPGNRLPVKAETLLLIATAAETEEAEANSANLRFNIERRDGKKDAALRAHALRRSMVHYKCDNSAKV